MAKIGWLFDTTNGLLHTIFTRDGVTVRIFFVVSKQDLTLSKMRDWTEARAKTSAQLVIITGVEDIPELATFAFDSGFVLIAYTEMDSLLDRALEMLRKRKLTSVSCSAGFEGVIDKLEGSTIIRGWVKLIGPSGLMSGLTIEILKDGIAIGQGVADKPRMDVTHDPDFPAGFRIDCGSALSRADFANDRIKARATDPEGRVYHLSTWSAAIQDARLKLLADAVPGFASSDIGRLLLQGGH